MVLGHRLVEADGADAVATLHRTAPGTARPAGTASRVAGVVAVCVTLGLAVFLVLPQPQGVSARSRLLGGEVPDPGGGSTTATRSTSYYTDGFLDLRVRGTLSSDPVLEVPADSPQLWRSTVLDVYDGSGWQSSRPGGRSLGTGPDYQVPLADEDVVPEGTTLRTDTVVLRTGANGAVVAPGEVTAVHSDVGHLIQLGTGLVLFDTAGALSTYTVTSVPEVLDPATLRAADGVDLRDRRWTQLPTNVPLRVRQLAAQVAAQARTRYDAVDAVERYLRSNETYRLDAPVPPAGEDPVDDFLFDSHQGFCEQFASAEVVLLRARGIPARLVTGFAYGQPAPNGRRLMLASDAHAWVEVWYPGLGWASSDPTAGAALAVAEPDVPGQPDQHEGSGAGLLGRWSHPAGAGRAGAGRGGRRPGPAAGVAAPAAGGQGRPGGRPQPGPGAGGVPAPGCGHGRRRLGRTTGRDAGRVRLPAATAGPPGGAGSWNASATDRRRRTSSRPWTRPRTFDRLADELLAAQAR